MILRSPCIITSRLRPGVRLADGSSISIGYSPRSGDAGRVRYEYVIDMADGQSCEGSDLQSGCGGGTLREGLSSLLSFLAAAAEAYSAGMRGRDSDNADLFPEDVCEWAYQNSDELSMLQVEVDELADCIEE